MRAMIEVALLSRGVPFAALAYGSEDDVLRWFAAVQNASDEQQQQLAELAAARGG